MEGLAQQNVPQVFNHYDKPPQDSSEYDATHDELTGLLNRRGMNQALDYLSQHIPGNFTVWSLDLDELKQTNDTVSYDAGDKLIQDTAKVISRSVRVKNEEAGEDESLGSVHQDSREDTPDIPDIIASRRGGDEFVVILPGVSDDETDDIVQGRVQENLERSGISASIGSAIHEGSDWEETLRLADKRMKFGKKAKKLVARNRDLDKQLSEQRTAFEALPRHKKLAAHLGEFCSRYAGVRPPS